MTDEEATLNEDSAATDTSTEEVDWQKRYTDTQAEYTRQQQALKEQESVWADEQALLARIGEKFPHLLADDEQEAEEDDGDDESPEFMTKAEFDAWKKDQATEEAQRQSAAQYEADIQKFAGDRELTQFGRNAIDASALRGEIKTPEQLEKAVNDWFAYEDSLRGPEPKRKAPHVLKSGTPNTGVKPFHEMTRKEREAYMVERAQGLAQT